MITQSEFHWLSAHGISVMLFLLYGLVYLLIGSFTPYISQSRIGKTMVILSPQTDEKLFGEKPENLLATNSALAKSRKIILNMLAGMLVACGTLIIGITWFGLKTGNMWALIILSLAGIIVLPFWYLVFKPYLTLGVKLTLSDIPPFIWVPAVLYLPAIILGWIGLKS